MHSDKDVVLDYAQSTTLAVPRKSKSRLPLFKIASQTVVLLVISLPIGALTIPLGHPYGLSGAAAFVISSIILLQLIPSPAHRIKLLFLCALLGLALTTFLHFVSINTIIMENASGQKIRRIELSNYVESRNVPPGAVARLRLHDLFPEEVRGISGGELADGTPLTDDDDAAAIRRGQRYHGEAKIVVEKDGRVRVSWL